MVEAKHDERRSRRRRIVLRLGAVVVGLLPLLLLEIVLAALGWGGAEVREDPFVGFSSVRPLFVLDESAERYAIPESRHALFRPESFAAEKADDEFRVFCLGGSTVQGRPYAIETSFTTWLEIALQAAEPDRTWEVVNCGGVSYASYRLVPILEEVLAYEPDLVILYTGHNEFLEDRTYAAVKQRPALVQWSLEAAFSLRTVNLLYGAVHGAEDDAPAERDVLPTEVEARLDYEHGLEAYERDDAWTRNVVRHYELNLRRMVQLCEQAGVPVLLMNPVSNLRDSPPFKNQHGDLSAEDLAAWRKAWDEAGRSLRSDLPRATEALERAVEVDPRYAAAHYELAKCYDQLRRFEGAKRHYVRAKDEDVCPLRMLEVMHGKLFRVARETRTPLLDVRDLFERILADERGRPPIPGGLLLVDHVHPSIRSHQRIAIELVRKLEGMDLVSPQPGWEERRDEAFRAHFESLDDFYFLQGRKRLEGLRNWAAGRSRLQREAGG